MISHLVTPAIPRVSFVNLPSEFLEHHDDFVSIAASHILRLEVVRVAGDLHVARVVTTGHTWETVPMARGLAFDVIIEFANQKEEML